MEQRRLATSLLIAQLVSVATVLRSVAFDRWITVLAGGLMFLGATAALRGKTWGVALAFMSAVAFPVAYFIGIAPSWFALVGVLGAMPFLHSLPAFMKFDRRATALLVTLATLFGAVGAIGWKAIAWDVFGAIPALTPSALAEHPFLLAAIAAAGVSITARSFQRKAVTGSTTAIRVADPVSHVRIAGADALELEDEETSAPAKKRLSA